jgi:alkaline phosphatase
MALCTLIVVLAGLVYVVGQVMGIPVRITYQTVASAELPEDQQPAPALPADSAALPIGGGVLPTGSSAAFGSVADSNAAATRAEAALAVQNVVLFVGDGMGLSMLATVDALARRRLAMSRMPVTGLVRTNSRSGPISDSGAGATAFATGFKTTNATIGMTPEGQARRTILEAAARRDSFATGVVTTSYLTDATPAAFLAHVRDRDLYDPIARQMIASRADVLLGGAQPTVFTDSLRHAARRRGFAVGDSLESFPGAGARGDSTARWLGLFPERAGRFDKMHGPPLPEVTAAALQKLRQRGERFFLLVEQEGTDAAGHINRLPNTRQDLRELDRAVAQVLRFAARPATGRTLVLVAADHDTGGLAITDTEGGQATARWNTFGHTATWTPLLAYGPGAWRFTGVMPNTALPRRLARLLELEGFLEEPARASAPAAAR